MLKLLTWHVIPNIEEKTILRQLAVTYFKEVGNRQATHLQHLLELIQSPARVQLTIETCQKFKLETIQH